MNSIISTIKCLGKSETTINARPLWLAAILTVGFFISYMVLYVCLRYSPSQLHVIDMASVLGKVAVSIMVWETFRTIRRKR